VTELKRARAVVNLCRDRVTRKPQFKGRVLETLFARTMLFEQANNLICEKLPAWSYCTWNTIDELKEIMAAEAPVAFPKMAGEYVRAHYSAAQFWQTMMSIL